MDKQNIEFNKERDFGEIFNATFTFISQNFKQLGLAIIYYALPFLLFISIMMSMVYKDMLNFSIDPYGSSIGSFINNYLLIILCYVAGYTIIMATVCGYISLYVRHGKDNFTVTDVWEVIKNKSLTILLAFIIGFIMIILGTILLILPGIYLTISMSMIFFIIVHEDKGFGSALSRSFELTHKSWWWTLLLLLVMNILVSVVNMIFQIPQWIIVGINTFHKVSGGGVSGFSALQTILTAIYFIISTILFSLPFIALSFQYFSIIEKTESPTLLQKIQDIGKDETTE